MSTQTLKSSTVSRVREDNATRFYSHRFNLGEGLVCPAGGGRLDHDVFGRRVSKNTLDLRAAECSHYTGIPAARFMAFENNHRPYLSICAAGLRGASDGMGKGRDLMVQNLYQVRGPDAFRGNFKRHFPTPNNAPWQEQGAFARQAHHKRIPEWVPSHDATDFEFRG